MMGVEAQLQSNLLSIGTGLLRSVGVVVPLLVWPDVEVFLLWQFFTTVFGVGVARFVLYRLMPKPDSAGGVRFSIREVQLQLPAAWASFLLATSATLNMNLDKIFVGKIGGLAQITEYSIASTFSQLIFVASVPISMTVTPRMVRAITSGHATDFERLLSITRTSISAITGMLIVAVSWHGAALIQYWSGGSVTAGHAGQYLGWLFAGSACLALSATYHCVAVANLDFSFGKPYVLSVLLVIPVYWIAIGAYGIQGAAAAWGGAQFVIMLSYMFWVSRKYLRGHAWKAIPLLGLILGGMASAAALVLLEPLLGFGANNLVGRLAITALELAFAAVLVAASLVLLQRRRWIDDALAIRADAWVRGVVRRYGHGG
jgi:O-antigen/teichoic acid export membrane protein